MAKKTKDLTIAERQKLDPSHPDSCDHKGRRNWVAPRPPLPEGHLQRCEDQVDELKRQIDRARTSIEARALAWKLDAAEKRVANARALTKTAPASPANDATS